MKKKISEGKRALHIVYTFTQIQFSRRILMLCTNFSKFGVSNDFVNKFDRLSFKQIHCIVMSSFSSRS